MSLENKEAYDWSVAELMERFERAYGQAAISGSGLVIDLGGGNYAQTARYLRGVIEARLTFGERIKDRPFRAGDFVKAGRNFGLRIFSTYIESRNRSLARDNARGKTFRVKKVLYREGKWWLYSPDLLSSDKDEEYFFPAEAFEVVPQEAGVPVLG